MSTQLSIQHQFRLILLIIAATWLWAAINPLHPKDWLLENMLIFITFAILGFSYRRFVFSISSYWQIGLFLCLHLYGSHYTYSESPFGFWLQESLDLQRNHYDRIVYFCFGLLTIAPFMEWVHRYTALNGKWLKLFGLCIILGWSAFYEVLEMAAALIVNPELGTAFLGTQGDEWDAQKDTGLAFLGGLLVVMLVKSSTLTRSWANDLRAS